MLHSNSFYNCFHYNHDINYAGERGYMDKNFNELETSLQRPLRHSLSAIRTYVMQFARTVLANMTVKIYNYNQMLLIYTPCLFYNIVQWIWHNIRVCKFVTLGGRKYTSREFAYHTVSRCLGSFRHNTINSNISYIKVGKNLQFSLIINRFDHQMRLLNTSLRVMAFS